MIKEFRVNEYITLKLENGSTNVYIGGKYHTQFKLLMVKKPNGKIEPSHISESYDDSAERLRKSLDPTKIPEILKCSEEIPPEVEFTTYCATLKNWADSDYKTDLLARNIAIPLLQKLTDVGDPLAKKIFKEEIAKRFNNGHLSFILYFIKSGYLALLTTTEERETIYYKNNEKLRDLIADLLQGDYTSKTQAFSILIRLIRAKDQKAKEILHEQILKAFNSGDLKLLDFFRDHYNLRNLSNEEKQSVFYENNKQIRKMINIALQDEENSLDFGFILMLKLVDLQDESAREVLKQNVRKLLLTGKEITIQWIIDRKSQYIARLFSYNDMLELQKDHRSPKQLIEYLNYYLDDYNKIIGFKKEHIISRKKLIEKSYIPPNVELPNSDFFLVFFHTIKIRIPYGIDEAKFIPIYNYNMKKLTINCHLSSFSIADKVNELKSKYNLLYEFFVSKRVKKNVIVHLHEAYFLDINIPSNEELEEMFTSIRDDVRIKIENLNTN
ncbi:MAG: hypothetical protein ACFFHV_24145 [Promethearchaeota archaeon]